MKPLVNGDHFQLPLNIYVCFYYSDDSCYSGVDISQQLQESNSRVSKTETFSFHERHILSHYAYLGMD